MEIQLQELLDKIKKEGVESAEAEAAEIRELAEAARARTLEEARREAEAIVAAARVEASRLQDSGVASLAQASRDCLLAFRDRLQAVLAEAVGRETKAALSPELLASVIPQAIAALAAGDSADLAVLVSPADLARLEAHGKALLDAELRKGLDLRPSADIEAGFRIVEKDGSAYYDFSAESLAEIFATRLNQGLGAIVKAAAAGL
jgi:V/A-type H+-transporting ATPase subunit E